MYFLKLAMFVERAADDEMCIYCLGVNNYFSFTCIFFLYFCHYSPLKKFEKLEKFHSLVKYG